VVTEKIPSLSLFFPVDAPLTQQFKTVNNSQHFLD